MTRLRKTVMMTALGLAVSACSAPETATRNIPMNQTMAGANFATTPLNQAQSFQPTAVQVRVPDSLIVSEANLFYPGGDIVWRGDLPGDRHQQVQTIFEIAANQGFAPIEGARPVVVDIEVKRFHALTEKTRYTVGGVHSIKFMVSLRDAETGQVLRAPREINADLQGYGGQMALEAEAKGLTQKYRITTHLARVLRDELSLATGFVPPKGGITARITPI